MSGWIEYFEQTIQCPTCKHRLTALFCEDVTLTDEAPITITSLATGQVICLKCKTTIQDADLHQK